MNNELEWKPITYRHQGNLIETAESESGYYARYSYWVPSKESRDGHLVAHTVGPTVKRLSAINAIKRHIDNRVIEIYGEKKRDM